MTNKGIAIRRLYRTLKSIKKNNISCTIFTSNSRGEIEGKMNVIHNKLGTFRYVYVRMSLLTICHNYEQHLIDKKINKLLK
jgi:hypothetical protein